MTEVEWIFSDNVKEMWRCLLDQFNAHRKKVGRRKLRLYGCATCRMFGAALSDPRSVAAVEYVERWADGKVSGLDAADIRKAAQQALSDTDRRLLDLPGMRWDRMPERCAAEAAWSIVTDRPGDSISSHWATRTGFRPGDTEADRAWLDELRPLSLLLRDIFGNPFRRISLGPSWLTTDVLALARGIYDERAFDRMPILADALQDAGCDNDDVLSHCRGAGPHVRGCWVVDLVLGKH